MKFSKKLLSILLVVITVFGVMCVAVSAENEVPRYITGTVDISICTPVAGEQSYGDTFSENGKIRVSEFTWYDADNKVFEGIYENGGAYTAVLTVVPNEGYLFDEELIITIDGEQTEVVSASEDSIVVKITYTCDDGAEGGSIFTTLWAIILTALRVIGEFIAHFIGY